MCTINIPISFDHVLLNVTFYIVLLQQNDMDSLHVITFIWTVDKRGKLGITKTSVIHFNTFEPKKI